MLPGFDATQHFIGPLIETADDRYECNVRGYHHLDDETWMVAGWYVARTTASVRDELVVLSGHRSCRSPTRPAPGRSSSGRRNVPAALPRPERRRQRAVVSAEHPSEVADVVEAHRDATVAHRAPRDRVPAWTTPAPCAAPSRTGAVTIPTVAVKARAKWNGLRCAASARASSESDAAEVGLDRVRRPRRARRPSRVGPPAPRATAIPP